MSNGKNIFDPEVAIPRLQELKKDTKKFIIGRKKLVVGLLLVILAAFFVNNRIFRKGSAGSYSTAKTVNIKVDKGYEFSALNNQGKPAVSKVKFKIAAAEKTDQVIVGDKTFTAKNNKLFLILNLELKNDATAPVNILPGDLIRLTIGSDEQNKFAPDLHNNLVAVAADSTKLDRVGFVIPQESKNFKLFIGELEGKKEAVEVHFPS